MSLSRWTPWCLVAGTWLLGASAVGQEAGKPGGFRLAWEHATPGQFPQALLCDTRGRPFLYAALKNGGLHILDIAHAAGPNTVAKLGVERFGRLDVMQLTQQQEYLYLALGDFFNARGAPAGLAIVHVKDPHKPRVVSLWRSAEVQSGAAAVVASGRYAYLGIMRQGVAIFDVSNPEKIKPVSAFLPDVDFPRKSPSTTQHPNARGLCLQKNLLYVAFDAGGLRVLDVTDKAKPKEVGRYVNKAMARKQEAFNDLVIHDNLAYLPVDYAGLEIVDVRNPRAMRQVGWWNPWKAETISNLWLNSPGHTNQIAMDWKKKLAYVSAGASQLQVIDIADASRPRLIASYGRREDKLGVWGLTISPDRVYLAYIPAFLPFRGSWAGIKALKR